MLDAYIKQSSLLLYSLIEGFADKEITNTLSTSLDFEFLIKKLYNEYEALKKRKNYED